MWVRLLIDSLLDQNGYLNLTSEAYFSVRILQMVRSCDNIDGTTAMHQRYMGHFIDISLQLSDMS